MSDRDLPSSLHARDYALLLGYCVVLFSFPLLYDRTLSTHETVHCVNIREMRLDGDWIIPHYGGRPWLERPPLPFWLTLPLVEALGDSQRVYRLAPLLVALPVVFLAAWLASRWFGRASGLLAGLILATIRELTHYAVAPECDMFLCGVITAALSLFAYLELGLRPSEEKGFLWGRRPWALLGFFVVLGLANTVKGLFFGDVLILVPVAAFLLSGADRWSLLRRYLWLPGWLAFAVTGSAWAVAAYFRYPDVVDLWKSDYVGRFNQGYMREPAWYYLAHLPWVLFPWSVAAFVGLWLTRHRALRAGRTPERFLWCWALLPIAVLSVFQGKHHHYLLHVLAPWAILAALGTVRLLEAAANLPWLRSPGPILLAVAVPGNVALALVVPHYPTPGWFLPGALVCWPALVLACWWIVTRKEMVQACTALFALLIVCHWAGYLHPPLIERRYDADLAFLAQAQSTVPPEAPLLVLDSKGPLDASWLLFYLKGRGTLLHNLTFLRDERIGQREAYLIVRGTQTRGLEEVAGAQPLAMSAHTRDQTAPDDRYLLYRLHFHTALTKVSPPYISPMQATGRALGPYLQGPDHPTTGGAGATLTASGRKPDQAFDGVSAPLAPGETPRRRPVQGVTTSLPKEVREWMGKGDRP